MADPTLHIPTLSRGETEIEWELRDEDLGLSGEFVRLADPISAHLIVMREGDSIEIRGRLEGEAVDECARCGNEARWPIDAEVHFFAMRESEDIADGDDDALLVHDGHTLELREPFRQLVLVSAPMVALCKEDCAGLCPSCGKDRNNETCSCETAPADPRWQALNDVLKKTEPEAGPN